MENTIAKSDNWGCAAMMVALFVFVCIIGFVSTREIKDNPNNHITTNDTIIEVFSKEFRNDVRYKQMTNVLSKIHYNGKLIYSFSGTPGYQHKLIGPYGCLNDTFPFVAPAMEKITNAYYRVCILRGLIIFRPFNIIWFSNVNGLDPYFIYFMESEKELLEDYYSGFVICDTIDNNYHGGWLKRLDKHWFLVSPDSTDNKGYY